MGLLDAIRVGAPIAANAVGTAEHAQAQAADTQRNAIIQSLVFQRKQRQVEIENALKQAQAKEAEAKATLTGRQAQAPVLGEPGYANALGAVAGAESAAKLPADIQLAITKGSIDLRTGEALARLRGQIEGGLQSQRFGFEQGQQKRELAGQQANHIAGIQATQAGQLIPTLGRKLGLLDTPATQQQKDWDAAAQHLTDLDPSADPSATLGARP